MPKASTLHLCTSASYALLAYFAPGFRWAWLGLAICFAGLAHHTRNQPSSISCGDRASTNRTAEHLEKDLQAVKIGTATSGRAAVCVGIAGVATQIGLGVASLLKGNSIKHDCSAHSGPIDAVSWKVYATGKNCDTTAQLDTIEGAMAEYLRSVDESVCGVHCIKLTHGGTWTGYVTLAPSGNNLDTFYCGSSNSFGQCVKGGKNDV